MQVGTKIAIGIGVAGAAALVGGGIIAATRTAAPEAGTDPAGAGSTDPTRRAVAPHGAGTSPGDDPVGYPGGGTSPGDEPLAMPVRGHVDPPGWWDDYTFDGGLEGDRLDATMDPRGWANDVRLTGRVDHGGWQTQVDPAGWANTTRVEGRRTGGGYAGTVDRPGILNDVDHVIRETVRGAQVVREGRFDEFLVPSFSEATWRSTPAGSNNDLRLMEFDPPGWGNTTRVTFEANVPAGVEATVAARLYDEWATEQERNAAEYPDPGYPVDPYPGDTSPGDSFDPSYPADPWYPDGGYPGGEYPGGTSPGDF